MDEFEETQWTDVARERYTARAEEFIAQIRRHVELTGAREGRQRELGPYFESAEGVQAAAVDFNESEFDWCGSFPLALRINTDDELDEDEDEHELDEDEEVSDAVLTVVGRWDYQIVDEGALVAAGRASYATTWPDDTEEDAAIAVADVASAVNALMHPPALTQLEEVDGLEVRQFWAQTHVHDGDEIDEDDPFEIAYT